MNQLTILGTALAKPLNERRRVTLELPELIIRAIQYRVEEANETDDTTDDVDFDDVAEWLLVSEVSIRRMPHLERSIPGFTAAMSLWMLNATYQPPEEE